MNIVNLKKLGDLKTAVNIMLELCKEFDTFATFNAAMKNFGTFGFEDRILHREELAEKLRKTYESYLYIYNNALNELEDISDLRIKNIIILKYIQGLSWDKIAERLKGKTTADAIKKAVSRYGISNTNKDNKGGVTDECK